MKDPKEHAIRSNTPDPNYNNAEEARVIQGSEQRTARALGEIKEGQVTRTDHSASATIETNDPMSADGKVTPLPAQRIVLPTIIIKPSKINDDDD